MKEPELCGSAGSIAAMEYHISARCLSYCHIATLACRSQNTSSICTVHAHLQRMQHRSTLVIPTDEGLRYLPDMPTLFRPEHSGTLVFNSAYQSQRNEASARASQPGNPGLCGHSCNGPAFRLSRPTAHGRHQPAMELRTPMPVRSLAHS